MLCAKATLSCAVCRMPCMVSICCVAQSLSSDAMLFLKCTAVTNTAHMMTTFRTFLAIREPREFESVNNIIPVYWNAPHLVAAHIWWTITSAWIRPAR